MMDDAAIEIWNKRFHHPSAVATAPTITKYINRCSTVMYPSIRSKLLQKLFATSALNIVATAIQPTKARAVHSNSDARGRYLGSRKASSTYAAKSTSTTIRKAKFLPVINGKNMFGSKPPSAITKGIKKTKAKPPSSTQRRYVVYCIWIRLYHESPHQSTSVPIL